MVVFVTLSIFVGELVTHKKSHQKEIFSLTQSAILEKNLSSLDSGDCFMLES